MFTETWLPNRDGVVTSLISFRRALEALGHEVHIFAAGSQQVREANNDERLHIYPGPTWTPYPDYRIALRPGPSRRVLEDLKVDLVHSHGTAFMGIKAIRCARMRHIPLLLTFHTRVEDATSYVTRKPRREAALRRLIWTWHRWYFNQCDAIVTPTRSVERDLYREVRRSIHRCFVVPTGIDADRFAGGDGTAVRKRMGLGDGPLVVNVGRVAWEKNLGTLLDAADRLVKERPEVTFVIGGRGPALDHFKREVARRGLGERVRFVGFVADEELPSLYAAADAFVMASTFETQGIALLEAMAAGLPTVAANAGGPTDFVDDGVNGFLFDGGSAGACADAIERALSAPAGLRKAARETAQRYTERIQAEALARAYDEVMHHPQGRTASG
jgi:1,2-diacylglycerol 3-alpha-glucosyltransferase